MGHELTGEVVAAGGRAGAPLVGRRVVVNPQVTCGDCLWCRSGHENVCGHPSTSSDGTRPGGFAELVAVPVRCIHLVTGDAAADVIVFAEPLATCIHALSLIPDEVSPRRRSCSARDDRHARRAAPAHGGRPPDHRERARRRTPREHRAARRPRSCRPPRCCATVLELTGGTGADLSLDAVGTAGSRPELAARAARRDGSALWLGMHAQEATVPAFDMRVREQRAIGSFAYTNAEFGQALGLLESGLLVPAVSRRSVPLAESHVAFRRLVDGAADSVLKQVARP